MRSRSFPRVVAAALASLLASTGAATAQSPSESPPTDPGLDAALAAVELMNRVPVGIRETCGPTEPFIEGMDTAIECSVTDGLVFYSRFVDAAAVESVYESLRASSGTASDTGPGCATGASESAYGDEDGEADGRVLCQLTDGAYISVWTHADEPILAGIQLDSDTGFAALDAMWESARLLEAGTRLAPTSSAAPAASSGPVASDGPTAASTAPADAERRRGGAPVGELGDARAPSSGLTPGALVRPLGSPTRRTTVTSRPHGRPRTATPGLSGSRSASTAWCGRPRS